MAAHERNASFPLAVQLSRPYQKQQDIDLQARSQRGSISETRELQLRLISCTAIQMLSQSLQLVAGTAMMVYNRFHLSRPITEFNSNDVVIACVFVASKMEDTSKKARDIVLAAHAVRNPQGPELNSDSPQIEDQRRRVIGLERMILETQCFDFRQRHPHPYLIKFARSLGTSEEVTRQAWDLVLDSYRTYLPIKSPPHVVALACLVLAAHFANQPLEVDSDLLIVSKQDLYLALEDLLDFYMHCKGQAIAGQVCSGERLMEIKSALIRGYNQADNKPNGKAAALVRPSINVTSIGDRGTCRYLLDPDRLQAESRILERNV